MLYRFSRLTKDYGERRILDIDQLALEQGKIYSLRGANGAGKSTLLGILAFLDKPSSGTIRFLGQDVLYKTHSLQPLRKQVVLVDQSPLLFSGSVWKNVEFGLKIRKIPKTQRKEEIERALEQVGMLSFAKADAQRLSGGETKRVALARGLAVNPDVLLLDEPAANVDIENQEIIFNIIKNVNEQHGTSVLFSTHHAPGGPNPEHQSLTLINGRLIKNKERNCFDCRVKVCSDSKAVYEILGASMQLELPLQESVSVGDLFDLYLDPEKIEFITPEMTPPEENIFSVQVLTLSREKKKVYYSINMGVDIFIESTFNSYKQYPVPLGQAVLVHIPNDAVRLTPMLK